MTRKEAIEELQSMCDHLHAHGICDKDSNMLTACKMAISALEQNESAEEWYKLFVEKLDEQEPCKNCGYAEGSPFCLKYCPHDAERKKEQEPCEDAVSRKKVEEITWDEPSYTDALNVLTEVRDKVRALPSVTRQTGEWIHLRCDMYECSKCRKIYTSFEIGECDAYYCPKCGARMVEPQKSEVSSEKDSN